jgi:hypothetical protein
MIKTTLLCLLLAVTASAAPKVTFLIGPKAPPLDKAAAEQLAGDFKALFDAETTVTTTAPADSTNLVLVGSPLSNPAIKADAWPKIGEQGIVIQSTPAGLIVGGGCPPATMWAVAELSHHFGIRHLLSGDLLPVEKPAFKLDGLSIVMEPKILKRGWSMFNGIATGAESWGEDEHLALLRQLVKLKFTHVLLPKKSPPVPQVAVDGDTGGRKAFAGAKSFPSGDPVPDLTKDAAALGLVPVALDFVTHSLGARAPSVLPQFQAGDLDRRMRSILKFKSGGFMVGAQMPGDLSAAAYFTSRVSFDDKITAPQALAGLVTPICGDGVAERVQKGFDLIAQAAKLIETNDPDLGVPNAQVLKRHLDSKDALPPWITEAKTHYAGAMNEMYRANTRAREGARSYTLHLAKRLEFTVHFFTALEAVYASHDAAKRAESLEAAVEALYNALNSLADAARNNSERGAIALLNENGLRVLMKALESAEN